MRGKAKSVELRRWLVERDPDQIGEAEFAALKAELAPVSEAYLRKLLRECGVPLGPTVEGVRQSTLTELEASLIRLLEEYESGDAPRRMAVRRLVITAKEHARLAARNPSKRPDKEEMILWMTTWLENPPVFRQWVTMRHKRGQTTFPSG